MRKLAFFTAFLLLWAESVPAQEGVLFEVSSQHADSLLAGNLFRVTFSVQNGDGGEFDPPAFAPFEVISGPNMSSTMRMANGVLDRKISYSYILRAPEPGIFTLGAAAWDAGGQIYETAPQEIVVLPNPDGVEQPLPETNPFPTFEEFWSDPWPDSLFFPREQPAKPKKPKLTRI